MIKIVKTWKKISSFKREIAKYLLEHSTKEYLLGNKSNNVGINSESVLLT